MSRLILTAVAMLLLLHSQSVVSFSPTATKGIFRIRGYGAPAAVLQPLQQLKKHQQRPQHQLSMAVETRELSFEEIVGRLTLKKFGQKVTYRTFELDTRDKGTFISTKTVSVRREGGIGLQLVEIENNGDGSGLVIVEGIVEGSNADVAGGFKVGDVLRAVDSADGSQSTQLLGKDYDGVLDSLSQFSAHDELKLTVQRLQVRGEVQLEVIGPDGRAAGEYTIISGKKVNLRTVLDAANLRIYDQRTARFDAPYSTGNCGGEGTCGTCMVAVMDGAELLNERVSVEDGALRQQGLPANYRWSCRSVVGPDPAVGGKLRIRLRPQSVQFDLQDNQQQASR